MTGEEFVNQVAERVREALDEAELRASQIVRDAEEEAKRIRTRAESEARERLNEVRHAIDQLQGVLAADIGDEVEPGPVTVPEPEPPAVPEPEPPAEPEPEPQPVPEPEPPPDEPTPPSPEPPPEPPSPEPPDEATQISPSPPVDAGAARLVALKLALDGAPREEVRERLAADYPLADVDSLLDDVYAKAGR